MQRRQLRTPERGSEAEQYDCAVALGFEIVAAHFEQHSPKVIERYGRFAGL